MRKASLLLSALVGLTAGAVLPAGVVTHRAPAENKTKKNEPKKAGSKLAKKIANGTLTKRHYNRAGA